MTPSLAELPYKEGAGGGLVASFGGTIADGGTRTR